MSAVTREYDSSHMALRGNSWYELDMQARALQPGLLPTFRIFIVLTAITPAIAWRLGEPMLGVRVPLFQILRSDLVFLIFLLIYTSLPWFREKMGRAFLPVALVVKTAEPVVRSYSTLSAFIPPAQWEYFTLIVMVRLVLQFQFTVIFTAWQYELIWPVAVGAVLCAVNGMLASPYVRATSPLRPLYITILTSQFVIAGVGLVTGLLVRNQRRQAAELDDRNRKLAHYASTVEQLAVTQERNRLARELHDTLAHSLSAVAVQIEAAQALTEVDTTAGQRMIEQALQTTRKGLTEARRSLKALRASPLEDLGLTLALRDLAESVAARAGLKLEFHIDSHLEDLSPEVEQCLYRVAQEALTNVARHASATSVRITVARNTGHVKLTIQDDGSGFDTSAVANTHYGLKGLRERAESIGGKLHLESEPDRGTAVVLDIMTGQDD